MTERTYTEGFEPNIEDFKRHLRITSDDLDETLVPCLLAAINACEHHIGKVIAQSEFTYEGPFTRSLPLQSPLHKDALAVEVDGIPVDYTLEGNMLVPSVEGKDMTVAYVAGMKQVPFDIKAAVLLIAAKLFNNPVDSVEALPSVAKNLLAPHRSWGIDNGE